MAVSIRNVEKFINDHPNLFKVRKEGVLTEVKKVSCNGIISGGQVQDFLGVSADLFFQEVTTDPDHIQIGLTDLRQAAS